MPVGGFPGINARRRRTVRAPVNPLDKSTIVSIYPRYIIERHWTIQPGVFEIQPGTYDKPSILVVGPSSWWKEIDEEQPLLEIPNSSIQVADAIVKGYCSGLFACTIPSCMPGLFWLPGAFSLAEIKKSYSHKVEQAKTVQDKFYSTLVRMADTLWARTNGNPLVISEDMRMAARELGLGPSKDWMKDFTMLSKVNCQFCGSPRNPDFPICSTCNRVCDPEKAKQLGLTA